MVNIDEIVENTIQLLGANVEDNYRIVLMIVGPPGSGKSTIAKEVCDRVNLKFQAFLRGLDRSQFPIRFQYSNEVKKFTDDIPEISDELMQFLDANNGILPMYAEDTGFNAVKLSDADETTVIGRGGLPNSIKIKDVESTVDVNDEEDITIAQVIPMDGFHLSRSMLDEFKDPVEAHKRRGSSMTFDSANFLQLCKILCKTSKIKPIITQQDGTRTDTNDIFSALSNSFISNVPEIDIPGFDHALKDPSTSGIRITNMSRVLIFEGLYLLYDKENWAKTFDTVKNTDSFLVYNIVIDEDIIQDRVAKRHFSSGLVDSYEEGVKKFQQNDLLNARDIKENTLQVSDIINITNE